jgi:thiosulfate/3-mercaptopyruvate sulfurtransferase
MSSTAWDALVTPGWLTRHLGDDDLVVLDCTVNVGQDFRAVSARADYEAGHIPGAGFADLLGDLRDATSPLEMALPTPEAFCDAMGALGVGDDSRVVLYDGNLSVWAARVWWMLRWVGFDRAAILNGGLVAWELEDLPLSTERSRRPPRTLTPAPRPGLIADRDEVLAAIDDEAVILVDTLMAEHYRGDVALYARPGHIPGATNVPAFALFDERGGFRPDDELAALLATDRGVRHITYCGGGIAASANAFAMTRVGFRDVAVYAASLEEWAANPENPLVVSDA